MRKKEKNIYRIEYQGTFAKAKCLADLQSHAKMATLDI